MKLKILYIITIIISFFNIAYASFDSPQFIINQSSNSIKTQQKIGDILVIIINGVAIGKAIYDKDWDGLTQYAYVATSTGVLTLGLKYGVNRERPDGDSYSFPSGHTAFSFAGATFLQMRYGSTWGIPALIGASFVGYSRIASQRHYTSDVLAGALIGILTNLYFTKPVAFKMNETTYNMYITPYVDTTQVKVNFHITL